VSNLVVFFWLLDLCDVEFVNWYAKEADSVDESDISITLVVREEHLETRDILKLDKTKRNLNSVQISLREIESLSGRLGFCIVKSQVRLIYEQLDSFGPTC
jgi:hypothetical protein